jgi:hypothetical protein
LKRFVIEPHSVAAGKRHKSLGKRCRAGGESAVHEDRKDANFPLQRGGDFEYNKVVGIFQAAPSVYVVSINPVDPDENK